MYCFNIKNSSIWNNSLLKKNNSSIWNNSVLQTKTVPFQTFKFGISIQFISIWPIDRNLSGATTPDLSEPERDGNEGILCFLQSSSISGISPSDCLVLYPWGVLQIVSMEVFHNQNYLFLIAIHGAEAKHGILFETFLFDEPNFWKKQKQKKKNNKKR